MTVISVVISCALWFADKVAIVAFRQPEYIAVVRAYHAHRVSSFERTPDLAGGLERGQHMGLPFAGVEFQQ